MEEIKVLDKNIAYYNLNKDQYISLTDIAKQKNKLEPRFVVINWLKNRNTIEYLGLWEKIHNSNFNCAGFDTVKSESGLNSFTISPSKWIKISNAKGIISKSGRYNSGTFAHEDIALEFASWISPEFKIYFINEFRRLKQNETNLKKLDWNLKRQITKINYNIHTDAIKNKLIPKRLTLEKINQIYNSEADILNTALFGMTAREWKNKNKHEKSNIRDYANIAQLICLSNLECINAMLINENMDSKHRLRKLNNIAINHLRIITNTKQIKLIK